MENRERLLNADEAAERFQPILAAGGQVTLAVTGSSMLPYLRQGRDRVRLTALSRPPRRGDIIFFRRLTGGWVLHRVLRRTADGCVVCGDAQLQAEAVKREQIAAVVVAVERAGRDIAANSLRFRAWGGIRIALRPIRRLRAGVQRRAKRRSHE